jgi:hypothetical protein
MTTLIECRPPDRWKTTADVRALATNQHGAWRSRTMPLSAQHCRLSVSNWWKPWTCVGPPNLRSTTAGRKVRRPD